MKTKKLKLALGILSGRINMKTITSSQVSDLGWDWHNPNEYDLRLRAEGIVLDLFETLIGCTIEDENEN